MNQPQFLYRLQQQTWLCDTVVQLDLVPEKSPGLCHQAGQYLWLMPTSVEPRPYSIANAPRAEHSLELQIRHTPDNSYTQHLLADLHENPVITLSGPYGDCTYPKGTDPIILLANSTGFAPMQALLEHATIEDNTREIHVFWTGPTPAECYRRAWLRTLEHSHPRFHYHEVADPEQLIATSTQLFPSPKNLHVFAAGPQPMIILAFEDFTSRGLPADRFYSDILNLKANAV
jgi:NAD(P)H-flavin reductase